MRFDARVQEPGAAQENRRADEQVGGGQPQVGYSGV